MTWKAEKGSRLSWRGTYPTRTGTFGRPNHGSYRLLGIKHQVFVELNEVGECHLIPGFHFLWETGLDESGAT